MGVRFFGHVLRMGMMLVFSVMPGLCLADVQCACPDRVHLRSADVEVSDASTGFKPYVADTIVWLAGMNVFEGPPERGAQLKQHSETHIKNGERLEWQFDPATDDNTTIWISCDYADGLILLAKPIGKTATKCTATLRKIGDPRKTEVVFTWE